MKHFQKNQLWLIPIFMVFLLFFVPISGKKSYTNNTTSDMYGWTSEEQAWLSDHQGKTLVLGLDPYVGMDYYMADGEPHGYIIDVMALFEKELGIKFKIADQYAWDNIFDQLKLKNIDILFGANVTEERLSYMSFSEPIHKYPYSVYTSKHSGIKTLSDIEGKRVGFLTGDTVIESFPRLYKNIKFSKMEFDMPMEGFEAVRSGKIDVFISANGGITKKFANDFPDMEIIADLTTFTSDMTLATRLEDQVFNKISNKVLKNKETEIAGLIKKSSEHYNRYVLDLNPEEIKWLDNQPEVVVGVADDYLPFDYYANNQYKGIAGDYLTTVLSQLGVKLTIVHGPFDELYQKALEGKVHVMNMAKTVEREELFLFTKPFSDERDEIFGDRQMDFLQDIYGLEGKKVAVVKGYWHKDYLKKNLSDVSFVDAPDVQTCIALVAEGKADYFIENPTVARYYIEGLGYSNVIQKGSTSQDSFLYFGVNRDMLPLVTIFNKSMGYVNYGKIKSVALQEVPTQKNVVNTKLTFWLILTVMMVIFLLIFLSILIKAVIDYKTQKQVLEERQKLIYLDGLTGIYNRLYFNVLEAEYNSRIGEEAFIMMDLNGLKMVNDTFGHAYGDQMLLAFAACLTETFSDGTVIRMGGDEFLVILSQIEVKTLEERFARLEENCAHKVIDIDGKDSVTPTAAVGWSIRASHQTVNEAIVEADQMMYQHKASLKRRRSDRQ